MINELEIFATGGVIGLRLMKGDKLGARYEELTNNYQGETIVFSKYIFIKKFKPSDRLGLIKPIRCRSLRLTFAPNREQMYIELDGSRVIAIDLEKQWTWLTSAIIKFRTETDFDWDFERGSSIFDDFNTTKTVQITVDKNYTTIWESNIGPRTRGSAFKVQFPGMFVYMNFEAITFATFFDEIQFSLNSSQMLTVKLLVNGKQVFFDSIPYKSVRGAVYQYKFDIKEDDRGYDTDTSDELSDDEGGGESKDGDGVSPLPDLPPTPPGMVRINGFLTPQRTQVQRVTSPVRRRGRLRPQRRARALPAEDFVPPPQSVVRQRPTREELSDPNNTPDPDNPERWVWATSLGEWIEQADLRF